MQKDTKVVLVNEKDNLIGFGEKFKTHKIPVKLHRAISILIFNKDKSKALITKRAESKPTWGGYWSNAVCSHPYPDESYQKAAERRLSEELGFSTPLNEVLNFIYEAKMDNKVWGEHELDHVFTGIYEGPIKPNPDEASGYEWIKIGDLKREIRQNPNKYTPWFKMIVRKLKI